jgi:hypothetical protein
MIAGGASGCATRIPSVRSSLDVDFAYVSPAYCVVYKRAPITYQDRAWERVWSGDDYTIVEGLRQTVPG